MTFGLYLPYWFYACNKELYDQFELADDRRDLGFGWLLYGYVAIKPLLFVYEYIFVANVAHVRHRLGFNRSFPPGLFIGLGIAAMIFQVALLFGAYFLFLGTVADVDEGASEEETMNALFEGASAAVPLFLAGVFIPLAVRLTMIGLVQAQMNAAWSVFDQRVADWTTAHESETP